MHSGLKKVTSLLQFENNILKLEDMINFKIGKFKLDFDKNKLPNYFNEYFWKTSQVHTRFTHSAEKQLLFA